MSTSAPTPLSTAVFQCKALALQARRAASDVAGGLTRHKFGSVEDFPFILAESRTRLWDSSHTSERGLELGKVQNLRCTVRKLNNVVVPGGEIISFWKQVGRATRSRGYVRGRQLREGCIYPAVGGGLCQLSNALYDGALIAGLEIVERHPHTSVVPGSAAARGRDATVAWNYIDLRFRPQFPILIEARLSSEELVLRFRTAGRLTNRPKSIDVSRIRIVNRPILDPLQHDCVTCGSHGCFRKAQTLRCTAGDFGRTAYIVDECWPEFRDYVRDRGTAQDILALPMDGQKWHRPRYAWDTSGFSVVRTATAITLARSVASRRFSHYGAKRLQHQLSSSESLAGALARRVPYDADRICIAQSLLPYFWRDGHLGGRRFDVLMTRLPLSRLHERLDIEAEQNPGRETLTEFRAPEWMVQAELEALAAADRLVTPHSEIAAIFGDRADHLAWRIPESAPSEPGGSIAFPGPTAARKGAYEVREAARKLDVEVVLDGAELEGDDFWRDVKTRRVQWDSQGAWLKGVGVVVQPALLEDNPRRLLSAIAAGVPVMASPACGLAGLPGVHEVAYGDTESLCRQIRATMSQFESPVSERT